MTEASMTESDIIRNIAAEHPVYVAALPGSGRKLVMRKVLDGARAEGKSILVLGDPHQVRFRAAATDVDESSKASTASTASPIVLTPRL
jgi:hypothetical protein